MFKWSCNRGEFLILLKSVFVKYLSQDALWYFNILEIVYSYYDRLFLLFAMSRGEIKGIDLNTPIYTTRTYWV